MMITVAVVVFALLLLLALAALVTMLVKLRPRDHGGVRQIVERRDAAQSEFADDENIVGRDPPNRPR